jgi:outer membrane protein TolC
MAKDVEKIVQVRFEQGVADTSDHFRARYQRLDAEIQLVRAKRDAEKAGK